MLIDTHCHLCDKRLSGELTDIIKRAKQAGVDYVCDVGYDSITIRCVDRHTRHIKNIYGIIGVHPHDAKNYNQDIEKEIINIIENNDKIIGLGEIGLDFHYNFSEPGIQKEVFVRQLNLARELDIPIVIHSRESMEEVLTILDEKGPFPARGIVHCFSGDAEQAKRAIDMGFLISIGGPVTYKNSKTLHNVVKEISIEHIVVETDAPYLPPAKKRGQLNEPANVKYVVEKIADLKLMTVEDVRRITSYNAKRLFSYRNPSVFPRLRPNEARIVYFIGKKMYLNITNRCTNRCVFCIRNTSDFINNHYLRLSREPTYEEIVKEISKYDIARYEEVVFCGFGEPTIRLDTVKKISKFLKERGAKKIRLDTNGTANLYHRRNVAPELAEGIDEVSISLNAHNKEVYNKLCHPVFGEDTYDRIIDFIKECKKYFKRVTVTALDLPEVDTQKCREIAQSLGVTYRQRYYSPAG